MDERRGIIGLVEQRQIVLFWSVQTGSERRRWKGTKKEEEKQPDTFRLSKARRDEKSAFQPLPSSSS